MQSPVGAAVRRRSVDCPSLLGHDNGGVGVARYYHRDLVVGNVDLSKEESHHARTVLRCQVGDAVVLFDGCGREGCGIVSDAGRSGVKVTVERVDERPYDGRIRLTLAVAMPRKPRQGFLFEKCTELGVWAIWPTVSERSVVKPGSDQTTRWTRTAIEAAKQCESAWLPRIEQACSFADVLERVDRFDVAIVTDARESFPAITDVLSAGATASRVLALIGPEGGFSDDEVAAAIDAGAVGARIGSSVLRIETAALTVAALAAVSQPPNPDATQPDS